MSDEKCAAVRALELFMHGADCSDWGEDGIDNPTPLMHRNGVTCPVCTGNAALSSPCPLEEENRVLRRVAEAYRALEALEEKAKQEWIEAEETPQECLEWGADMEVAGKEKNAALAEAKAKGVILR